MTAPTAPTAPPPGVAPDLVPSFAPPGSDAEALLGHAVDEAMEEWKLVGVSFGTPKVYCYSAPPLTHVGSIVVVPPSWYDPDPQTADVVTLDPPPYRGPIKRVLAVLS